MLCLCSHRKSRYRVAHPTFAPRALRALDTAPRSATVSPNVRSTEGSGRRITVCAQRARLLRAGLARVCSGHICKLQNRLRVDAVQRQACSPLPPKSSCASPPGRGGKAWEGARPTSRVPARNEGTEAHPLLKCLAFPAAECLMAISAC